MRHRDVALLGGGAALRKVSRFSRNETALGVYCLQRTVDLPGGWAPRSST